MQKPISHAAAFALAGALAAGQVQAGGFADVIEEGPVVIVEEAAGPARMDWVVPLLVLSFIALAASSGTRNGNDNGENGNNGEMGYGGGNGGTLQPILGGGFNGGGDGGPCCNAGNASDIRLKTDIVATGTSAGGLPLYQFRYIGGQTTYEGVMAQDVLLHTPEAVIAGPFGYYLVDYDRLGLEMRALD